MDKIQLLDCVGEYNDTFIKSEGNKGFIKVLSFKCTIDNVNGSNLVKLSKGLTHNLSKKKQERVSIDYRASILLVITKISSGSNKSKNTKKWQDSAVAVMREAHKIDQLEGHKRDKNNRTSLSRQSRVVAHP